MRLLRPRARRWLDLAVAGTVLAIGITAYFTLREPPAKSAAVLNRLMVDQTNAVIRATGREPTSYATGTVREKCDNGMGGYDKHDSLYTARDILDVTPEQAPQLVAKVRDFFQNNSYGHVVLTSNVQRVKVSASKDGVSITVDYDLQGQRHLLAVETGTDCVVDPKDLSTAP